MTDTQVRYWQNQESIRHNRAMEDENVRHNKVVEEETKAHNIEEEAIGQFNAATKSVENAGKYGYQYSTQGASGVTLADRSGAIKYKAPTQWTDNELMRGLEAGKGLTDLLQGISKAAVSWGSLIGGLL